MVKAIENWFTLPCTSGPFKQPKVSSQTWKLTKSLKGDETKEDAFDYLERGEMTFNKERNPPPPETIHHLDVKLDEKLFEKLRIKKST